MDPRTISTPRFGSIRANTLLQGAIMDVLKSHMGHEKALTFDTLIENLRLIPPLETVSELQVKVAIRRLRKSGGALICSSYMNGVRYWLASHWFEVLEFIDHEYHVPAIDLLETEIAMLDAAREAFGDIPQLPPF